jgi:hypothetical protein
MMRPQPDQNEAKRFYRLHKGQLFSAERTVISLAAR